MGNELKRTMSTELRAIRVQMQESPPPAPAGTGIREWFAGLALMNPELMKGLTAVEQAAEAVRLADELIRALAASPVPSVESMAGPSESELKDWAESIATQKVAGDVARAQNRATAPAMKGARKQTAQFPFAVDAATPVPPSGAEQPTAADHFRRASDALRGTPEPRNGSYCYVDVNKGISVDE